MGVKSRDSDAPEIRRMLEVMAYPIPDFFDSGPGKTYQPNIRRCHAAFIDQPSHSPTGNCGFSGPWPGVDEEPGVCRCLNDVELPTIPLFWYSVISLDRACLHQRWRSGRLGSV